MLVYQPELAQEDPGKIPKYKVKKSGKASGAPTNEYVSHFGDVLRQAIDRSQKGQCHRHHK